MTQKFEKYNKSELRVVIINHSCYINKHNQDRCLNMHVYLWIDSFIYNVHMITYPPHIASYLVRSFLALLLL